MPRTCFLMPVLFCYMMNIYMCWIPMNTPQLCHFLHLWGVTAMLILATCCPLMRFGSHVVQIKVDLELIMIATINLCYAHSMHIIIDLQVLKVKSPLPPTLPRLSIPYTWQVYCLFGLSLFTISDVEEVHIRFWSLVQLTMYDCKGATLWSEQPLFQCKIAVLVVTPVMKFGRGWQRFRGTIIYNDHNKGSWVDPESWVTIIIIASY